MYNREFSFNNHQHLQGNKRADVHLQGKRQDRSSDHIVEMIPPINTLGREFLTSTAFERKAGDLFRVVGKLQIAAFHLVRSRQIRFMRKCSFQSRRHNIVWAVNLKLNVFGALEKF